MFSWELHSGGWTDQFLRGPRPTDEPSCIQIDQVQHIMVAPYQLEYSFCTCSQTYFVLTIALLVFKSWVLRLLLLREIQPQ